MMSSNSISEHLISFDAPVETAQLYTFPDASSQRDELKVAHEQIAELQHQLKIAKETASAAAKDEIEALVKTKDQELQAGMDELRATYETKVGQLAEQLQTQILQHNKELSTRLVTWCRPVLKNLSTARCMEDLAAVVETMLNEASELKIEGPEDLIAILKSHLTNSPSQAWTFTESESSEIVISAGEAHIESCLGEWLSKVEDGFSGG